MADIIADNKDDLKTYKITLKKTFIYSRQILLYFVDVHNFMLSMFDPKKFYRVPLRAYENFRLEDKEKFRHELYRLKKQGLIKIYLDGKEKSLVLTNKGKNKIKKYILENFEIKKPKTWDKKWRVVIFDIPDKKKFIRDILRQKLYQLGFIELQESVYVFPFDCFDEIDFIRGIYSIKSYVQYLVVDRIETEIDLVNIFYDAGFLTDKLIS